jgi:hypothetical protein
VEATFDPEKVLELPEEEMPSDGRLASAMDSLIDEKGEYQELSSRAALGLRENEERTAYAAATNRSPATRL